MFTCDMHISVNTIVKNDKFIGSSGEEKTRYFEASGKLMSLLATFTVVKYHIKAHILKDIVYEPTIVD